MQLTNSVSQEIAEKLKKEVLEAVLEAHRTEKKQVLKSKPSTQANYGYSGPKR